MNNMFGNNPMAGMEGLMPTLTGKWINKKTGNYIIVRDNIISSEGMQVILQDGSVMDMNEFSRDYIQMSDETYDSSGNTVSEEQIQETQANNISDTSKFFEGIEIPDAIPIVKNNEENSECVSLNNTEQIKVNPSFAMVEKVISKIKSKPTVDASLKWSSFPKSELNMLINFFDVSVDDIAEYIYNNYFDKTNITKAIAELISAKLNA